MSSCEWGYTDCKFEGIKCDLCFNSTQCYKPVQQKKFGLAKVAQKADKRQGSNFEYKNHKANVAAMNDTVQTSMTLNSGATNKQKGDEQIVGIIRIMEELKTKVKEQAPGKKTFTIKKEWLDKLAREAPREEMEFWYLKFSFQETDDEVFIVVDQDVIMSMVKTMIEDRRIAKSANNRINLEIKRRELVEADLIKLKAENELLKAEKKILEEKCGKNIFQNTL